MKTICAFPEVGCSKGVPIAILLCPLKFILDLTNDNLARIVDYSYCEVDRKLVTKCCRVFADLKRIVIKAEALSSAKDCSSLPKFLRLIWCRQESLKEDLLEEVFLTREASQSYYYSVERFVQKAEQDPFFNPLQLEK